MTQSNLLWRNGIACKGHDRGACRLSGIWSTSSRKPDCGYCLPPRHVTPARYSSYQSMANPGVEWWGEESQLTLWGGRWGGRGCVQCPKSCPHALVYRMCLQCTDLIMDPGFNHSYIVPVQKQYEPGAIVCACVSGKFKYDITIHPNKSFEGVDLVTRT